ncbi:hypothetical protein [Nocardiopsis halophila]|uniref:hypothetical protein n=1 Tax=Nocardiopsis halophila TaxID=141692 RepID=UPI00034B0492|nr:hypothetical protein [Nocardiopsis halophila]
MRVRAFAALVRLESLRMLRNPVLLAAVAVGLWNLWSTRSDHALLDWGGIVDSAIDSAPYPAFGAFITAFFPGSRERRYGGAASLPLPPRLRLAALLASAAAVGALATVPSGLVALRPWSDMEIAGVLSPAALAIAPGIGAAAAAGGVALGMWTPSWTLPLLLLAVFPTYRLTWTLAFETPRIPGRGMVEGAFGLAAELLLPAGSYAPGLWGKVPGHLAFLALLFAGCCALALVRAERRRGRPRLAATAATAVFAAGTLGAYAGLEGIERRTQQSLMEGRWTADMGPVPERVCERLILEYCGYETYESWFPYWQRTAEPVAAAVPERAHGRLPTVEQGTYAGRAPATDRAQLLRNGTAVPDPAWDPASDWSALLLAEKIAVAAVDAPQTLAQTPCTLHGQARYPLLLWLVVQGVDADDGPSVLRQYLPLDLRRPSGADVATALAMLDRPDEEVAAALDEHWERLVDPSSGVEAVAPLLDLEITQQHMAEAVDLLDTGRFTVDEQEQEWFSPEDEMGVELIETPPCT